MEHSKKRDFFPLNALSPEVNEAEDRVKNRKQVKQKIQ